MFRDLSVPPANKLLPKFSNVRYPPALEESMWRMQILFTNIWNVKVWLIRASLHDYIHMYRDYMSRAGVSLPGSQHVC